MKANDLSWILRWGAAGCFIGHGAFGIITKAAWVPYFGVVGIPESIAWKLMPLVGTMDILMGILALVRPTRALFFWGVIWCFWTALLRPLSGESFWETLERAGNYGVPAALLVFTGLRGGLFANVKDTWANISETQVERLARVLRWTTAILLAGHAGCNIVVRKPLLANHYLKVGFNPEVAFVSFGILEFALAGLALTVKRPSVFLGIFLWKLACESLFPVCGSPCWELVERAGSYAAPLALFVLLRRVTAKETTLSISAPA